MYSSMPSRYLRKWERKGCKLYIFTMQTERCGMGLIADEDIKAGSFLIEYVGEGGKILLCSIHVHSWSLRFIVFIVCKYMLLWNHTLIQLIVCLVAVIDDKTCEERLWVMKKQGEVNFYMCEISREMVIDATFKGNLSRYINHSCHPNSELQKW